MTTIASITLSVDGFITGPDDRPGQGLGVGGERLHYWSSAAPGPTTASTISTPSRGRTRPTTTA
jgi:hypothetical protein